MSPFSANEAAQTIAPIAARTHDRRHPQRGPVPRQHHEDDQRQQRDQEPGRREEVVVGAFGVDPGLERGHHRDEQRGERTADPDREREAEALADLHEDVHAGQANSYWPHGTRPPRQRSSGEQPGSRPHRRSHTTSSDVVRYADLFAQRTTVMRSSAMRDLMEITSRPEVISLAGGFPDTSTFPPESFAAQMTRIAQEVERAGAPVRADRGIRGDPRRDLRGDGRRGHDARSRRRRRRPPAASRRST